MSKTAVIPTAEKVKHHVRWIDPVRIRRLFGDPPSWDGKERNPFSDPAWKAPTDEQEKADRMQQFTTFEDLPRQVKGKTAARQLYGIRLIEKQKMKLYYGNMREKRFKRLVEQANADGGNRPLRLMERLEMRVNTALFRAGFFTSYRQIEMVVAHKSICLNGEILTESASPLKVGDVIHTHPLAMKKVAGLAYNAARERRDTIKSAAWVNSPADVEISLISKVSSLLHSRHAPWDQFAIHACGLGALRRIATAKFLLAYIVQYWMEGMVPFLEVNRNIMAVIVVRRPTDEELEDLRHACWLPYTSNVRLRPEYALQFYHKFATH